MRAHHRCLGVWEGLLPSEAWGGMANRLSMTSNGSLPLAIALCHRVFPAEPFLFHVSCSGGVRLAKTRTTVPLMHFSSRRNRHGTIGRLATQHRTRTQQTHAHAYAHGNTENKKEITKTPTNKRPVCGLAVGSPTHTNQRRTRKNEGQPGAWWGGTHLRRNDLLWQLVRQRELPQAVVAPVLREAVQVGLVGPEDVRGAEAVDGALEAVVVGAHQARDGTAVGNVGKHLFLGGGSERRQDTSAFGQIREKR